MGTFSVTTTTTIEWPNFHTILHGKKVRNVVISFSNTISLLLAITLSYV